MKFNIVVMQYNGQITDRGETSSEKVRASEIARQLIRGFDQMLDEHLPQVLDGVAEAAFSFLDDESGQFQWRQPEPFSATAAFFIGDRLKFTWFYLAGIDAESDRIAVNETARFIQDMAEQAGQKHQLQLPPERPLALCVPWPPSPNEMHRRIVGNYATCLATAFFEKTAAIHAAGQALFTEFQPRRWQWDIPGSAN